jgi:ATP-dependent DNA helicase RecG
MLLADEIRFLKGVGEATAQLYARLGIRTVRDLIDYYPRTYDDYSAVMPVSRLKPGMVTVKGVIRSLK